MSIKHDMQQLAHNARLAAQQLISLSSSDKNHILHTMADHIDSATTHIMQANSQDIKEAKQQQLSDALIDRLYLDEARIHAMAEGLREVAKLDDPIHQHLDTYHKANGLIIHKVSVPIGVIVMIYESRPNVTADVAALTLKTANAIILRGGKEAYHSNQAIYQAMQQARQSSPLPEHAIQLVQTSDHQAVTHLIQLRDEVDLVIPRGGERLINTVVEQAQVPVIKHYKGLCHIFVDKDADLDMACDIIVNAKCQRPGVCNAVETLLIHQDIAKDCLAAIIPRLHAQQVHCKACPRTHTLQPQLSLADERDWDTEYLDLTLSIKIVDDSQHAIAHINRHGSHHSDAIISANQRAQDYFTQQVDSATVYVNASTRFTDGAEFGMGAEIGISTDKLHARGPMGLKELTTYKYIIQGQGQIR